MLTDAVEALKNNPILSFAKVTASNSTVYNDLGAYQLNETYSQAQLISRMGSINGFVLSGTTVDANIKKEKLNTTELGVNLGFLKSRISLDAAYFMTKTTDLITNTTPSISSGATAFLTNIGELKGKGFELSLGGTVIQGNKLSWDLSVNYSTTNYRGCFIKEGLDEIHLTSTGQVGVLCRCRGSFPADESKYVCKRSSGKNRYRSCNRISRRQMLNCQASERHFLTTFVGLNTALNVRRSSLYQQQSTTEPAMYSMHRDLMQWNSQEDHWNVFQPTGRIS